MTEASVSTTLAVEPEIVTETEDFSLVDIEGKGVPIPKKLPWGKEKKILAIVGMAFEQIMPKKDDKENKLDPGAFLAYLPSDPVLMDNEDLLKSVQDTVDRYAQTAPGARIDAGEVLRFFANKAPDLITQLISIITGKSEADVDNQFEGESVLKFAVPYVMYAMRKYASSFTQSISFTGTETMQ
jgi:hypothetical protein